MSDQRNPYCLNYGNVDGRIRFGTLDPTTNTINSIQIESGYADLSTPHYMSFHRDGKFGGGTTFKCPGVFQIECASNPVNNIGFFLHSVDGDIVIGSPNGRVRIFGETVDIIASICPIIKNNKAFFVLHSIQPPILLYKGIPISYI